MKKIKILLLRLLFKNLSKSDAVRYFNEMSKEHSTDENKKQLLTFVPISFETALDLAIKNRTKKNEYYSSYPFTYNHKILDAKTYQYTIRYESFGIEMLTNMENQKDELRVLVEKHIDSLKKSHGLLILDFVEQIHTK